MEGRVLKQGGFTALELVATVGLIAIIAGIAVSNLKEMSNPLANASVSMEHFLRLARARAIANTEAIKIAPQSATRIVAFTSDSCSGTMTPLADLSLDLPPGSSLNETVWTVCYSQRGLADNNIFFRLIDLDGQMKTVHVALGGGTKID